jgi:hypothetical protein
MSPTTAFCTREKIDKPIVDFTPSQIKVRKNGLRGWCRACCTEAAYRVRNGLPMTDPVQRTCEGPECEEDITHRRAHAKFCSTRCSMRHWHAAHPGAHRTYVRKCVYGITDEQFNEMLSAQGGVCGICGGMPPEVDGKYGQWNVDHCHETGFVRGILCSPCNIGIGQLGDSIDRLRAAIRYLTIPPRKVILVADVDTVLPTYASGTPGGLTRKGRP